MTADSVEDMGPLGSVTRRNAIEQKKVKGNKRRRQPGLIVSCLLLDSLMLAVIYIRKTIYRKESGKQNRLLNFLWSFLCPPIQPSFFILGVIIFSNPELLVIPLSVGWGAGEREGGILLFI